MMLKGPRTCLITVTNKCILRCEMCHLWRLNAEDNEISVDDYKKFIDSLRRFGNEPIDIHLIGGEALIRKDILELIKYTSNKGHRTVMTSCGYVINESMAKKLVEAGLNMLNLSLDSLNPSIHNFLRGREDSFQHIMQAIDYLSKFKDNKMKLGINTVISEKNMEDIAELAKWAMENKNLDSIYFMAIMRPFGSDLGWDWFEKEEYKHLWPQDYHKVEVALDKLIDLKNKGFNIENSSSQLQVFKSYFKNPFDFIKVNRCNVSEQAININALGDMYICFFMEKLGNIRDHNAVLLWNSSKAQEIRRQMKTCRNNCELVVNCYYEDTK